MICKGRIKKYEKKNEEIIFKWDREWIKNLLENVFGKSGWLKGKSHCSFSKQYKNLESLLEMLLGVGKDNNEAHKYENETKNWGPKIL